MPVDLNALMGRVAALPDNERMHVSAQGDLQRGTGLKGLRRILIWARSAESRQAAAAFKNAIAAHPVYQAFAAEVNGPLDALIAKSKPLTAARVRETLRTLDLASALQTGRALAGDAAMPQAQRRLPLGYGADFAQFCIRNDLRTSTDQERAAALGGYLKGVLIPASCRALSRLPAGTAPEAAALMERVHGPAQEFLRRTVDRLLAGGLQGFTLQALENAWAAECAQDLALVSHLSAGTMASIRESGRAGEILAALHEARPLVGDQRLNALCDAFEASSSLATRSDRVGALAEFFIASNAHRLAAEVLSRLGLPEAFAAPLARLPQVLEQAREQVLADSAPGTLPDQAQVCRSLETVLEEQARAHGEVLSQLSRLAREPVVGLSEPLTEKRVAQLAVLVAPARPLLAALGDPNARTDVRFLRALSELGEALAAIDPGADAAASLRDALVVMSALSPELKAQRLTAAACVMTRGAELAGDLNALNLAVSSNRFGVAGLQNWMGEGVRMTQALVALSAALLELLSPAQREAVGAAQYPDRGLPDAAERRSAFFARHFEQPRTLEAIAQPLRDRARAAGLVLPAPSAQAAAADARLLEAQNRRLAEAVLAAFLNPQDFGVSARDDRAFLQTLIAENGLDQLDADIVCRDDFRQELAEQLDAFVRDADGNGQRLTEAALRERLQEALIGELTLLQDTFAAIDQLPERAADMAEAELRLSTRGFTDAEKRDMKLTAMRYGLRDVRHIDGIARTARLSSVKNALRALMRPMPTAMSMDTIFQQIGSNFSSVDRAVPPADRGARNAFAMYLALALRAIEGERAGFPALLANVGGDLAKRVAASYLWLAAQPGVNHPLEAERRVQTVNALVAELGLRVNGTPLRSAPRVDTPVAGLREIPGGLDGLVNNMKSVAGPNFFDPLEIEFVGLSPKLTDREEIAVRATYALYKDAAADSEFYADQLANWLVSDAKNIAALYEDNGGRPATPVQLWKLFTDSRFGRCPAQLEGVEAFGVLMDAVGQCYMRLVQTAAPDIDAHNAPLTLVHISDLHIPVRRMFALTAPGSRLSLADIRVELGLGSLSDYTSTTAYGLVTDFRRQPGTATWTLELADGRHMIVHPGGIPPQDNRVDNPIFIGIADFWRQMAGNNEVMLCRIGQAFSQASLIYSRELSQLFPGVYYSEHGSFQMSGVQQPDGRVIVDIRADPDAAVGMHIQIIISPDGSARYSVFDMWRA